MATRLLTSLSVLVTVLMIDAAIEVGFVSCMVVFLHGRSRGTFSVNYPPGQSFELQGQPSQLLQNEAHTSNGAAATAIVLIGFGGLPAIWLQKRRARMVSTPMYACGRD